jgi:hypothetical protein
MDSRFQLKLDIPEKGLINRGDNVLSLGSCFSEIIGRRIEETGMNICVNPNGIIYNPLNITDSLTRIMNGNAYTKDDLNQEGDVYYSFQYHTKFSGLDPEVVLDEINNQFRKAREILQSNKPVLLITLGSAQYFTKDGSRVANCHKLPSALFEINQSSVNEIVTSFEKVGAELDENAVVILTVSPVRYVREGLVNSTESKSILHVAVRELCRNDRRFHYFPSYELVIDVLRDYRFYAEDMLHPSPQTEKLVWDTFASFAFDESSKQFLNEAEKLIKTFNHKSILAGSQKDRAFQKQKSEMLHSFVTKYQIQPIKIK